MGNLVNRDNKGIQERKVGEVAKVRQEILVYSVSSATLFVLVSRDSEEFREQPATLDEQVFLSSLRFPVMHITDEQCHTWSGSDYCE